MHNVLLIGARGQLGSEIRAASEGRKDVKIICADRPEVDVRDPESLAIAIKRHNPQTLINTAAFHEVDLCEEKPDEAFLTNAVGALNAARAAARAGVRLVFISTDYVFDGQPGREPFTEDDPPNPASAYAITKRAGENFVLNYAPDGLVIRTCGLYGAYNPSAKRYNFPELMLKLARRGKPISVVDDQVCTPTWTKPLAELILNLLETDISGIVHATCEGAVSWCEFAAATFEIAGVDADLEPSTSEAYGAPARRPKFSVLENERLKESGLYEFPDWRDALENFLHLKGIAGMDKP